MAALGSTRGQAIVLDNPRDPLSILLSGRQQDANNAYRQQQMQLRQQQKQDNDISKLVQQKYLTPPDVFKQWGQNIINKANSRVFEILQANPNADPIRLRSLLNASTSEADSEIAFGQQLADRYKEVEADSNLPGIDQIRYKENLAKLLKGDPHQMDQEILENFSSLPMNFDVDGLVGSSVKDIKDQYNVDSTGKPTNTMFGQIMTIENNQKRFTDIDKTLDYVLGGDDVTDGGKIQNARGQQIVDGVLGEMATENVANKDDLRAVYNEYKRLNSIYDNPARTPEERMRREQLNNQVRDRVRPKLEQLDQTARGVKIQRLGNFPKEGKESKVTPDDYTDRVTTITALQNPFSTQGDLTPEAQQAAARIKSGKLGAQNIIDVKFTKGGRVLRDQSKLNDVFKKMLTGDTKGGGELLKDLNMREQVKVLPSDRAVLSMKVGSQYGQLQDQEISIDLSDPGAEALINSILTTSPNEKKILYPDLLKFKKGQKVEMALDEDNDEGFLDE